MSTGIETRADAWQRRGSLEGQVDFTMMYVAHDAFNRDLGRLVAAARAGRGLSEPALATWHAVAKQLHTHHNAEDTALWPRLAAAVKDADEQRILEEMEMEHASLDPGIERIDAAVARSDEATLLEELETLALGLSAHMVHEESAALPLLERRLGQAGWEAFTKEIRSRQGGLKGAAEYLPWILDGVSDPLRSQVLHLLPPPARLLFKRFWEPGYRTSDRLH